MPFFAKTRRVTRNIFIFALIATILLHEPSFTRALDILINAHIILCMVLDVVRDKTASHFPIVADFIKTQYGHISRVIGPSLRSVARYIAGYVMTWMRRSPRYLCILNTWIAEAGSRTLEGFSTPQTAKGIQWIDAAERVADMCIMIQDRLESGDI
jgi:hypothetical protein